MFAFIHFFLIWEAWQLSLCLFWSATLHITPGFPAGSDGKASASNAGDPGSFPGLGRSPGGGNGNPLQYSFRESPMDGGAWSGTVHGVTKSQTCLSDFTFTFSSCPRRTRVPQCPRPQSQAACSYLVHLSQRPVVAPCLPPYYIFSTFTSLTHCSSSRSSPEEVCLMAQVLDSRIRPPLFVPLHYLLTVWAR